MGCSEQSLERDLEKLPDANLIVKYVRYNQRGIKNGKGKSGQGHGETRNGPYFSYIAHPCGPDRNFDRRGWEENLMLKKNSTLSRDT